MDTTGLTDFLADADFSGVVLVKKGTVTLFEAASGQATRRWGIPNTLETRFDTASITKLFTSVAVLQQVEAGTLDLETSIHHYVDLEGTTIDPAVTLLHLLTHTSGIADVADDETDFGYAELWATTPTYSVMNTSDYLPLFAHKEPLSAPGVDSSYSDAGYILAGLALEKVTGRPYRQYVYEDVFTRAAMKHSGFYDRRDAAPRVAEGWDRNSEGLWVQNLFSSPPIGSPDSGAHATAGDLIRFQQAVRNGELLNPEWTEEFFIPQVQVDDVTMYGFGLEFDLEEDGSVRSYHKDGVNAGASGILRYYLEPELDVVVLSNSEEGAWDVVRELDERLGG